MSHRTQKGASAWFGPSHPLSSMQSLIPPPGEAAGLALGLVMLGSKSAQAIEDMVGYAQETQHEKILRGLAVGIAMVMYGRMEEADALIESLCRDKVGHERKNVVLVDRSGRTGSWHRSPLLWHLVQFILQHT